MPRNDRITVGKFIAYAGSNLNAWREGQLYSVKVACHHASNGRIFLIPENSENGKILLGARTISREEFDNKPDDSMSQARWAIVRCGYLFPDPDHTGINFEFVNLHEE